MKKIIILSLFLFPIICHAQNNAIFNGGNGDGWQRDSYTQAAINIFAGGNGDGWHYNSYTQAAINIFAGGNGDGWHYDMFEQTNYSIFNGGGGDGWANTYRPLGPLPVTWLTFTANKSGTTVNLDWQIAAEKNASHYVVERKGASGTFDSIGIVYAAGNSNDALSYRFIDEQPLVGANFYRIKQVDMDNSYNYTPIRLVNFDGAKDAVLFVYPVPAASNLMVSVPNGYEQGNLLVTVRSRDGRLMAERQMAGMMQGEVFEINVSSLSAGTYFLTVASPTKKETVSFIKQ